MSPQPASLLPPPACGVAHPMVVKLFTETDAGDQLTDAQDEQRHARPAGRSRSARVMRVAARDRDRPRRHLMDERPAPVVVNAPQMPRPKVRWARHTTHRRDTAMGILGGTGWPRAPRTRVERRCQG